MFVFKNESLKSLASFSSSAVILFCSEKTVIDFIRNQA